MSQLESRYMEFRLGTQLYALPLLTVKEVISKPEVTQVPNMPPMFEGMFNLRGQILGVFNVRKKLNAKPPETALKSEVVIVIDQLGVHVGMLVDEVTRVIQAGEDIVKPAPLREDDPARHFIGSVIQLENELIMTVNVNQLLDLEKYKNSRQAA